jgi:D-amino-acid dehydrogenase
MTSPTHTDVLIVGGGIVGLACAWYLLKAGRSVRIVEQRRLGNGSSFGNSGLITPSLAAPLAGPGVLRKVPGWLADPRSPLYVKPRLDLEFFAWAWRFASFCNEDSMLRAMRARHALLASSRLLYDELIASEGLDCDWDTSGLYLVYRTEEEMRAGDALDPLLEELGIAIEHIAGAELLAREPALREGVVGARHYPGDARLRPDRLLGELRTRLTERGAMIEEDREVRELRVDGDQVAGVGDWTAGDYLVATGAWTARFGLRLGLRLPIQPGKGYSLTMPRPARCPSHSLVLKERQVGVTPWASGFRIGGTMEFAGYDERLNTARIDAILAAAREYLVDPLTAPDAERWYGWRPMTPDGLPLIGRSPRHRNLYVAAGHNMLGVSMSPGTGRLVAELVTGQPPHLDATPYALERFD